MIIYPLVLRSTLPIPPNQQWVIVSTLPIEKTLTLKHIQLASECYPHFYIDRVRWGRVGLGDSTTVKPSTVGYSYRTLDPIVLEKGWSIALNIKNLSQAPLSFLGCALLYENDDHLPASVTQHLA